MYSGVSVKYYYEKCHIWLWMSVGVLTYAVLTDSNGLFLLSAKLSYPTPEGLDIISYPEALILPEVKVNSQHIVEVIFDLSERPPDEAIDGYSHP